MRMKVYPHLFNQHNGQHRRSQANQKKE